MDQICGHEICNRELEDPSEITFEEMQFILSCLVEHGLIEWVGIGEDGQNVYRRVV